MRSLPLTSRWITATLAAAVAVYILISVRNISCPGLNYDEVNWANIALGEVDDSWISQRIGRFPFLLALPYVGAVKGYLMRAVFWSFGVSVSTIRVPGIVIGSVCVVVVFLIARKVAGNSSVALAAAWLLAINPEFIQRMRMDLGPVAIDLLCKETALLLLIHLTETFSAAGICGVVAICALGIWNKLTFIWYINAFTAAGLAICRREWLKMEGRRVIASSIAIVSLAVFLIYTLWVYVHWDLGNIDQRQNITWMERARAFTEQLRMEFAGISSINFSLEPYEPAGSYFWAAVRGALLLGGALTMLRDGRGSRAKLFFVFSAAVTLAEVGLTKAASWPWHSFAIEPFVSVIFVVGISLVATFFGRYRAQAFGFLITVSTAYSGVAINEFNSVACRGSVVTREGGPAFWRASMDIYPLIEFAKSHPTDQFVCLDWGLRTQLMVLGTNPGRTLDYDKALLLLPHYLEVPDVFFVIHTPETTAFPQGRDLLYSLAKLSGKQLESVKLIGDGSKPEIEILRVRPI